MTAFLFVWAVLATAVALVLFVCVWASVMNNRRIVRDVLAGVRAQLPPDGRRHLDALIAQRTEDE